MMTEMDASLEDIRRQTAQVGMVSGDVDWDGIEESRLHFTGDSFHRDGPRPRIYI